jgi:two-component system, NarL family, nitrate/nitrite response regulator NarL
VIQHIRVLIVDDVPILRVGARGMLAEYEHIDIVGEATNGVEAVALTRELRPDVVLMDISMPQMDGVTATRTIVAELDRDVAIVGLTVSEDEEDVAQMLTAGACGYILKDSGPTELVRAIEDAHAGRFPLDRSVAQKMVSRLVRMSARREVRTLEPLTPREKQVMLLVVRGLPNKAIAQQLGSSESTIKTHLREVFRKLKVDSRAAAAAKAVNMDLSADGDAARA